MAAAASRHAGTGFVQVLNHVRGCVSMAQTVPHAVYWLSHTATTCAWSAPSVELLPCAQLDTIRPDGASGRGFRLIRDDLLHPVAGGNKLRKLDALLPALLAAGTTDVVRPSRAALCSLFRPACMSVRTIEHRATRVARP